MKKNTKSSITLPPDELAIVNKLLVKLNAKSKVEVIRRGLKLLNEQVEAELLREQFKTAVDLINYSESDLEELDNLVADGLDEN